MSDFTESFDARLWAEAFKAHVVANPSIATDEGTLHAWFANAIMRGYDEHARKYPSDALINAVGRYDYDAEHRVHLGAASMRIVEEALTFGRPHVDKDGIALDMQPRDQSGRIVAPVQHAPAPRPDGPWRNNRDNTTGE